MKDFWKNYITTRFFYYQLSIRSVTAGRGHGKDKAKWQENEGSEPICQPISLWKHIKHSGHRKPKLKSYSVNSDAIINPSLFNSHVKIKSIFWWLQRLAYERQYLNKQTNKHTGILFILYTHKHTYKFLLSK